MNYFLQSVKEEFKLQKFGLKYKNAANFVRCQWQRPENASVAFLAYRCLVAVYFLVTLFMCMCNVGRTYDQRAYVSKWPIYLTNWGYTLNTLQAFLGTALLVRTLVEEGKTDATIKRDTPIYWCIQLYWVLYTTAVVIAFAITGSFWVAIYDPAHHELDFISLVSHVFNSIVLGIDFFLVAHPIRLLHFHWPVGFLTSYFAFSLVYYWLGGTDVRGQHHIYNILDWQRPIRTCIICALALLYVIVTHVITWALYMCRRWMARTCVERQIPAQKESVIMVNSYV